ncbi:MAG TPA: hypothetical protein VFH42_00940, partial [Sporolactobacillaceae bacterium]|nr:hypothetical protein [Sporolactobacillaceae bacterium]
KVGEEDSLPAFLLSEKGIESSFPFFKGHHLPNQGLGYVSVAMILKSAEDGINSRKVGTLGLHRFLFNV